MERALNFRSRLLETSQCSFSAEIIADYTDKLYTFAMECTADEDGKLSFQVNTPESISGISGNISAGGGRLVFDNAALQFDLLADRQLSPVSAPWIMLKTLRSGYLTSVGMEDGLIRLTMDDSYEEGALQVDVWMNETDQPVWCEILYKGKRILSLSITDFEIL